MLQSAVAFLVAVGFVLPYAVDSWPLDTAVVRALESATSALYPTVEASAVARSVASEQKSILRADVVFIGILESEGIDVVGPDHAPYRAERVLVDRCLKGDSSERVSLHRQTGLTIYGNAPLGTRQPDWSSPRVGRRYLFLAHVHRDDPAFLLGGCGHGRYELADGVVVSKGVPESEFVAAIEALLGAAAELEESSREAGGAIQPSN
jgi:hypothetical protein